MPKGETKLVVDVVGLVDKIQLIIVIIKSKSQLKAWSMGTETASL